MKPFNLLYLFLPFLPFALNGQAAGIPLQSDAYHLLDRLEIKTGVASPIHPELKFFSRKDAARYALKLDSSTQANIGRRDRQDIQYLADDNNEWIPDTSHLMRRYPRKGFWRYIYPTPANFFEVNVPDFKLRVNPILDLEMGSEKGNASLLFQNRRGLEVRGEVDRKLYFYTNLIETQARYQDYVSERVVAFQAVPGAGFYKNFRGANIDDQKVYDFNIATAYMGFQASRHFGIQIGHGKHFIGNGYRSMFFSDYSAPGFFLKLDTRVWKFHYQNLFLELNPVSHGNVQGGNLLPKKYAAIHYLNFKLNKDLAFGFFEASVFNRSRQFELQYLNPVIFYRTVEGMIGSPDNVLIGVDGHYNFLHHFQIYGQFLLDELVVSEVFSGSGWWANKWGIQGGLKYINAFGIEHLDLQFEHNRARPYTYSHYDPYNSYTHYNQPLAHPLGSNFEENILLIYWRPVNRLSLNARFIQMHQGENSETQNWGANPLLDYDTRVMDYGNEIGQGVDAQIQLFGLDASWRIWHNAYIDLKYLYRRKNSADDSLDRKTQALNLGFRLNMWNSPMDF